MKSEMKINLQEKFEKDSSKKRNGLVSFTAGELSESNLDELAYLAQKLEKVGITIEITRKKNHDTGIGYDFIVMKVDEEKYHDATTRHAGRKADFERKYDTYGKCTVKELREKLKNMSKTNIAKELGCSRMTLYRILEHIEERNPSDDTSIWHYTS